MALLSASRAAALLRSMRERRVLVLGDVMLDEFLWGRVSRISPEAPVPVVQVTGQSFHLGGAGNVAASVRSLGGGAVLAGVVGQDAAGERVREGLAAAGVVSCLVALGDERPTTVKTRIVAHGQQVVRADREDAADVPAARADGARRVGPPGASLLRRPGDLGLPEGRRHRLAPRSASCPSRSATACRSSWTRSCATSACTGARRS